MPIYEVSYRSWQGHVQPRPRTWLVIARTGIRLLWKRSMIQLIFLASIPFIVKAVEIYIKIVVGGQTGAAKAVKELQIQPDFFYGFLNFQLMYFLVFMMILAGAGLIVRDRKFNALPIYFSKPVSFWDYVIGKFIIIAFYSSLITLVPGLLLFLMCVLLSSGTAFLEAYYWVPFSIIGFCLLIIFIQGGLILALSSAARGMRSVTIFFFALLIFPWILQGILSGVPEVGMISLLVDLKQVGSLFFGVDSPYDFPALLAIAVLIVIFLLSYGVLWKKVRPTEVVK